MKILKHKSFLKKKNHGLFNKKIKLSIHKETHRIVIKVIDTDTNKVVREIPPKELLDFISLLHESLGLFIDKKR